MIKLMKYSLLLLLVITSGVSLRGASHQLSELLTYQTANGKTEQVSTPAQWKLKRVQQLAGMEHAMGPLPTRTNLPPFNVQIMDSLHEASYTRLTISFTVAENENLPAYLYVPHQPLTPEKLPAMVALHPTSDLGKRVVDGQSALPNRAYAKELAQRGYVVIAPDYPSMGDLSGYNFDDDRYASGTMKAVFNHMRCVDLLQVRGDVDPQRIAVIGHSLGGHNALFVGAFDSRLSVIVSSCGWTLLEDYDLGEEASERYGGRLGPWDQERYMPRLRDQYQLDPQKIPFDFDGVIAALAPRAFFSSSPLADSNFAVAGVERGIAAAAEVYRLLGVEGQLQVRYPQAKHDFPPEIRQESYRFIDKTLNHQPTQPEANPVQLKN